MKYRHRLESSKVIELTDDSEPEVDDVKKHHCDFEDCDKAYKSWFDLQRHRALHYKSVCIANPTTVRLGKVSCSVQEAK